MCRIGWPKPSAVSCMRASRRAKPQSHGGRAPHAAHDRSGCTAKTVSDDDEQHDRARTRVARTKPRGRRRDRASHQRPNVGAGLARRPNCARHECEQAMTCARQQARAATQPAASQSSPMRSTPTRVVRVGQSGLTRLSEEDHAEELHHDVAGERCGERERRRRRAAAACSRTGAGPRAPTGMLAAAATPRRSRSAAAGPRSRAPRPA